MPFPFYRQFDTMDCGPTCLKMVAKFFGKNFKLQTLRSLSDINRDGVSLLGISVAAEKIGFRSLSVRLSLEDLKTSEFPVILHWRAKHFVVLYKVKKNKFYIADPAAGLITFSEDEFCKNWISQKHTNKGVALLLSPGPLFYDNDDEKENLINWSFLVKYLTKYKKLIIQLFCGLCAGSILQLVMPFLTQSVVDVGVNGRNLSFISIILIAQVALVIGQVSIDFIRSWILLHISTRLNVSILTDFLIKLMKLPISFFDTKMTGDILQRMNDQRNIQSFLTGTTLTTIFSMFNLIIFSFVLAYYNSFIFLVFLVSSILYVIWIILFLKQRRNLNYKSFEVSALNQSKIVQLINGMQEIKLNNSEKQKRWEWEYIQARLFRFSVKTLALNQYQQGGGTLINQGKNIFITFLSAKAVIEGNLTLGSMVAIQYIVGQLSSPIDQLLAFIQNFQDAKISLERLNEIHDMHDEEPNEKSVTYELPEDKTIYLKNLTFKYPGAGNLPVLKNITLTIPQGKTTAIVGMSGSGKTTILKLLLRFYPPVEGEINIGGNAIDNISFEKWRDRCGVVMQEGFIFSDTIERNIAVGDDYPDRKKLLHAINVANLQEFVDSLPTGLNSKIGAEGNGISQGQKQRILIARAVYKNPDYIFFDEATNSLDANNENVIMNNLESFFLGKTVLVVAHRLSTISNADNIVVLKFGEIIEEGTHQQLIEKGGAYYTLIRNQLELGS